MKLITLKDGRELWVRIEDARTQMLLKSGGTQMEKIAIWKKMAALPSGVCLDIGANYGEFLFVDHQNVVAFEPNSNVFACLQRTCNNKNNIRLVNKACSDGEGSKLLYVPKSSGAGSLIQQRDSVTEPVELVRASDWTHDSFVAKIDVEGHEYPILKDLVENAKSWFYIIFEQNPTYKPKIVEMNELLRPYKKWFLSPRTKQPIPIKTIPATTGGEIIVTNDKHHRLTF